MGVKVKDFVTAKPPTQLRGSRIHARGKKEFLRNKIIIYFGQNVGKFVEWNNDVGHALKYNR